MVSLIKSLKNVCVFLVTGIISLILLVNIIYAQDLGPVDDSEVETATASPIVVTTEPTPIERSDLTQKSEETTEPLKRILDEQALHSAWPGNPIKFAIRGAVDAGVPPNTIVLLLLLPGVAALIAAARHLIGLRGFGIFLPAALAVTFVATGPVVGIALFLI